MGVRNVMRRELVEGLGMPVPPCRHVLDQKFFSLLTEAYLNHLEPFNSGFAAHMELDAKPYKAYNGAYGGYCERLLLMTKNWVKESEVQWANCEEEMKVLRDFRAKLWWLLRGQLFRDNNLRPKLTTREPLLCSAALVDRTTMVLQNQLWLAVIATWCEPLMIHVLTRLRSAKPFLSVTDGLFLFFRRIVESDMEARYIVNRVSTPFPIFQPRLHRLLL